jgi:hemerythrin
MSLFSKEAIESAKKEANLQKARDKKRTILLVDDEKYNLTALENLLSQDYAILTAGDGEQALDLVTSMDDPQKICLIISDQRMPNMSGVEFLYESVRLIPNAIRILLTAYSDVGDIIDSINKAKIYQYIMKPFDNHELQMTIQRAVEMFELEKKNRTLVKHLKKANQDLQEAIRNLHVAEITTGVYWLQIPEADLYILCGCPADVVKHMISKGFIASTREGEIGYETGPNAILLSEVLIQNGQFSNLAEFPVLQMFYRQGMIIPNHPNNKGKKPMLIGSREQVAAQMEYIFRGSYGLTSMEELLETGISQELANEMMIMKQKFAFGKIRRPEELLSSRIVEKEKTEIKKGVFVARVGFNKYEFEYKDKTVVIDLNLKPHETYTPAYELGFHQVKREYFAVLHSGEGDGWDIGRPCMSSILIFQGRIYLIDAGPDIRHTLRALSIDTNEIEGIFHTHAHDDHFAGLPSLMQSDHRIKYYASPLVRKSVANKLSALMSIDESTFGKYFDVQDLDLDVWNEIEGLEVKPMFSPHPVETNIFLFRALGESGYKTYAHWADLSAFDVIEAMLDKEEPEKGISKAFYESVKENYLTPANLKKVDVGGGMIHGKVGDFKEDRSDKIILAHTSEEFALKEKEVGSGTSFGTLDTLISTDQDYLRRQAAQYVQEYFPEVPPEQQRVLLNAPIFNFNPGSIILKHGEIPEIVFLILLGSAEFIQSEFQTQNTLSTGCFLGDVSILKDMPASGTWRAISYVRALGLPAELYRNFMKKNELYDQMYNIAENIEFLQKTSLFGERISYPVQNRFAHIMNLYQYASGEILSTQEEPGLYLLKSGELEIQNSQGKPIETIKIGGFCGEDSIIPMDMTERRVHATQASSVFFIENNPLLEIPAVQWKLLETSTKRRNIIDSLE